MAIGSTHVLCPRGVLLLTMVWWCAMPILGAGLGAAEEDVFEHPLLKERPPREGAAFHRWLSAWGTPLSKSGTWSSNTGSWDTPEVNRFCHEHAGSSSAIPYDLLRFQYNDGGTQPLSQTWHLRTIEDMANRRMMMALYMTGIRDELSAMIWPEDPSFTGPQRWLNAKQPTLLAATTATTAIALHVRNLARSASVALPNAWTAHVSHRRLQVPIPDGSRMDSYPPPAERWLVAWTAPEGHVTSFWTVDPLTGAARIVLPSPTPTPGP